MIVDFAFKQRLKIQLFENDGESKEKLIILYISTKLPGLLVYSILKIIVQLQMLYCQLDDQHVAPPT